MALLISIFETTSFYVAAFLIAWTAVVAVPFACLYLKRHRDETNHPYPLPPGSILDNHPGRVS